MWSVKLDRLDKDGGSTIFVLSVQKGNEEARRVNKTYSELAEIHEELSPFLQRKLPEESSLTGSLGSKVLLGDYFSQFSSLSEDKALNKFFRPGGTSSNDIFGSSSLKTTRDEDSGVKSEDLNVIKILNMFPSEVTSGEPPMSPRGSRASPTVTSRSSPITSFRDTNTVGSYAWRSGSNSAPEDKGTSASADGDKESSRPLLFATAGKSDIGTPKSELSGGIASPPPTFEPLSGGAGGQLQTEAAELQKLIRNRLTNNEDVSTAGATVQLLKQTSKSGFEGPTASALQRELEKMKTSLQKILDLGIGGKSGETVDQDGINTLLRAERLQDVQKFEITGDVQQALHIILDAAQSIWAEPGSMLHCDNDVRSAADTGFGCCGCFKGMCSAPDPFVAVKWANKSSSEKNLYLCPKLPSKVVPVSMIEWGTDMFIRPCAFLAATDSSVRVERASRKQRKIFETAVKKIKGQGLVFLSAAGLAFEQQLQEGDMIVVDRRRVIAWQSTCQFSYRRGGTVGCTWCGCAGKKPIETTVTGPGKLILQGMPILEPDVA